MSLNQQVAGPGWTWALGTLTVELVPPSARGLSWPLMLVLLCPQDKEAEGDSGRHTAAGQEHEQPEDVAGSHRVGAGQAHCL